MKRSQAAIVCLILLTGETTAAPVKGEPELLPGQYRVKVEPLVEPPGDIAIYCVQIWAIGKHDVTLRLDDGRLAQTGAPKAESGGKLHRCDYVLLVAVRTHPNPMFKGTKLRLEQRALVGGAGKGGITVEETVGAEITLDKFVDLPAETQTLPLGQKHTLGQLGGKKVSVSMENTE